MDPAALTQTATARVRPVQRGDLARGAAYGRTGEPAVVMFVLNPVTRDRRVLKEAASLARRGASVSIIGINLVRDPRPAYEETSDGVAIMRVPLSMAPEWWRPSTRYFLRIRDQMRRRGTLTRQQLRRSRGRARLAYQRRRHRTALWIRARRRRLDGNGLPIRKHAIRGGIVAFWERAARRAVRLRAAGRPKIARWRRLTRAFFGRQVVRLRGLATQRSARRWAAYRIASAIRAEFHRSGGGLRSALARVGRGAAAVGTVAGQLLFTVWAAVYLTLNHLSRGELDWALTARYRWTSFANAAAKLAPEADVYHGHDLSALGAAIAARNRHGRGRVVYDSHELYVESGTIGSRSRALKSGLRRIEQRMFSQVDHLICVNRVVADELHRRYGAKPTTLIHNCPPRWSPPAGWPNLIRQATGIPDNAHIALYQGGFSAVRGLRQLAEAIALPGMEQVHLVYLGFGPMEGELRAMADDRRFGGRLWVLPAVEPEDLDAWVSSADVSMMPNQPTTLNEVVSTPNKLFESIAAGVPVVTSDFPERRRIVLEDPLGPLGAVCDPTDPASIADAIKAIVGPGPLAVESMRRRCLRAAHERWNWETEESRLATLYDQLTRWQEPVARRVGAVG